MQPFAKDILLIDFEASGANYPDMMPTQLGAILLDKGTLEEKRSYLSNINIDYRLMTESAIQVTGLTEADLANAPTMAEVGKQFHDTFGTSVILASWVQHMDSRMLEKLCTAAGISYNEYDYHFFDLWPAAYVYLLKNGYTGTMRSEPMFQALGLPPRDKHNALEDCRHAAEILRIITK